MEETEKSRVYYCQPENVLVIKLETELKKIEEIEEISLKWNRFVEKYSFEEFTGHYKYTLRNKDEEWKIKMKIRK